MADARGETSDLFEALAHHRRKAFSALTAVPSLTLGLIYPETLGALPTAHAGTHPPVGGPIIRPPKATPAGGVHPFHTRPPSVGYRTNGKKRDAPSTSQKNALRPARGRALSGKSFRCRTRIRDTVHGVSGHEGV
jgi:hypothetical protein